MNLISVIGAICGFMYLFWIEVMDKIDTSILGKRILGTAQTEDMVDWAVDALEKGFDTPSLRILAGLSKYGSGFETEEYFMPISAVAHTPYYVLMDDNGRIGPEVLELHSRIPCLPIYGFSGRHAYETFRTNSQQTLRPYPLVKRYLQEQSRAPRDGLKLVVIDAAGPREPYLNAATMIAVLEGQENRATQVASRYRLVLDDQVGAYRVEEASL